MKKLLDRLLVRLVESLRWKALLTLLTPLPQAASVGTALYAAKMAYFGGFDPVALVLAALVTLVLHVLLYGLNKTDE